MSFKELLYLDKDFISSLYEESKGVSPDVLITKSEGLNAGAKALFLSAGAVTNESKSFKVSTFKMLEELAPELSEFEQVEGEIEHSVGSPSKYGWVQGTMSISGCKVTRERYTYTFTTESSSHPPSSVDHNAMPAEELVADEKYFAIKDNFGNAFALVQSEEFFLSGIESLIPLAGSVVDHVSFPVEALLRVLPAKNSFGGWVSVPLIVREQDS
ncbi:hypothetical protein MHM89_13990 [Pseudoalteromonas sp. CNC9-20]|uniref:hypothetical protein n=1 Tax=Pseudoalteromonas sp. CNC9-20 TaxID=2917750 RepID=UPI001EF52DFB|nr:hypothetical protein [Pseudoalteromonas sp. CNC9-20]MCG7571044.1 hypothetical protein [Pseudoalteromonas sp. CNC9-20]